ncbi:MAG: DUF349 domain-containing protein [Desulfobacterales bacterium]|nr:DUF349 domain-containing protein [Desulfobacterales bacterium]
MKKEIQEKQDNIVEQETINKSVTHTEQHPIAPEKQQEISALLTLCELVEKANQNENRFEAEKKVRTAQETWNTTGTLVPEEKKKLSLRFKDACTFFFKTQSEFKENLEWERWANFNRKTELCEVVEALIRALENNEPIQENISSILRDVQAKWKEIGPVSKDKSEEIWNRFKQACDHAYEICLRKKQAIFDQAKQLTLMSEDWETNAQKIKEIQNEWNKIGYLPATMEKDIKDAFQLICDQFFEARRNYYKKLDTERIKNLQHKKDLCEQVEQIEHSTDYEKTANILKELQNTWKEIGPIPKKEGDELWMRFRSACNRFFKKFESYKLENLKKKESLCESAEKAFQSIQGEDDIEKMSHVFVSLQKEWKEIGPVPIEVSESVWQRFHNQCESYFSLRKDFESRHQETHEQNLSVKEKLVHEIEALIQKEDWKAGAERIKQIQDEWKLIGHVPSTIERELNSQLKRLCNQFFKRRKRFFDQKDQERKTNLEQKEELCLRLEILAKLVFKSPDIRENQRIPMAKQLEIALAYKDEIVVEGDKKKTWNNAMKKFRTIQKQWKEIGPVPRDYDDMVWKRYRKLSDQFLSDRSFSYDDIESSKKKEMHG